MLNWKLLDENIIALLGLESLSDEEKAEMITKMSELVQKRVLLRVMELLSNEDQNKMAQMEQGDPALLVAFVAEKVPNFDTIVKEEIVKIKEETLKVAELAS